MKKLIFYLLSLIALILSSCYGDSFTSTIVVNNNSQHSYYFSITCSETNYNFSGTIQNGGTIKTKVKSGYTYGVLTYEVISMQLHSSNYINAQSDKTYTVTINN